MLATRVTAFFRSDPGERVHQARVIANGLASYDDANVGLTKLLEAASGAKVHDRVSLTADLLTLVDADVAQYVATSASPIWERRVGSDAILALLKAAARDGSAHSRMAIGRFAASDDVLNREAAVEAMADIEDDWSVRKLSERIELDPEPFIRELAVEYLGELLE